MQTILNWIVITVIIALLRWQNCELKIEINVKEKEKEKDIKNRLSCLYSLPQDMLNIFDVGFTAKFHSFCNTFSTSCWAILFRSSLLCVSLSWFTLFIACCFLFLANVNFRNSFGFVSINTFNVQIAVRYDSFDLVALTYKPITKN